LSKTIHSSCTNKNYPTNSTRNYTCPNNQAVHTRLVSKNAQLYTKQTNKMN
jgi:hypothetical protein